MLKKTLLCGNEAISESAIQAGCRHYYGYPITPQNEISAYMAKRMPQVNGVFIQAESELAAVNMAFGTAATGKRVMTSSSSPGMSLKQEGISYLAACELPVVIVDVMRAGPGLGNITPSQADYYQATRGGGHGDYRTIVIAPASVQESFDLTKKAFYLADKYRIPVLLLLDGMVGQMREPLFVIEGDEFKAEFDKSWCLTGCKNRGQNIVRSLYLDNRIIDLNEKLQNKYSVIQDNEVMAESYMVDGADVVMIAYGTPARMCREVVDKFRAKGAKVGLLRLVSLWPFPEKVIQKTLSNVSSYLVVEWSAGQMLEDVRLSVGNSKPIHFLGKIGGQNMEVSEIENKLESILEKNGAVI